MRESSKLKKKKKTPHNNNNKYIGRERGMEWEEIVNKCLQLGGMERK